MPNKQQNKRNQYGHIWSKKARKYASKNGDKRHKLHKNVNFATTSNFKIIISSLLSRSVFSVDSTNSCTTHTGASPCYWRRCYLSAVDSTNYCISHIGASPCHWRKCNLSAVDSTNYCTFHTGASPCYWGGCNTSAVDSTNYCTFHTGKSPCQFLGCHVPRIISSIYCNFHNRTPFCQWENCHNYEDPINRGFCIFHNGRTKC
jgi:hypothetical protein